jgi:magnesium transporter
MLSAYVFAQDGLVGHPASIPADVLAKCTGLDMVEPSHDEEMRVEEALGFDIPTRGELAEIEASSCLCQKDGTRFLQPTVIAPVLLPVYSSKRRGWF